MPLEIVTVPCRSDNYAFLVNNSETGETAIIDAPEAGPLLAAASQRGWTPTVLVLTHHHGDHVEGLPGLSEELDLKVIGAGADAHRLPKLDETVADGDVITLCGHEAHIIDVSGHTVGHIAIHIPQANAAFTADSLMALGCGRVFEGTMDQMWSSLSKLAALPPQTTIYSGHEYTAANAKFALTIEPDNPDLQARVREISEKRAKSEATVPSKLSVELATNPFLRASNQNVRTMLGMENASDSEVFAEIRTRKDNF